MAVTEFALPSPRRGSIDIYSGFGRGQNLGQELHLKVQRERAQKNPTYQSEVWISHKIDTPDYIFEVGGRMDGIFYSSPVKIEEIKSSFNIFELGKKLQEAGDDHPY